MKETDQHEKWEYCRLADWGSSFLIDDGKEKFGELVKNNFLSNSDGNDGFKSIAEALNVLGAAGWECFATWYVDRRYFLFKRRL
jgi:hypothetical protein